MKILLVNDDGIGSERLDFAAKVLSKYGDVLIVAPAEEQSGKSASITIGRIEYTKLDANKFAIKGTPADCVSFALHGLEYKPDIVVSGINRGYNIGIDTLYSGTVGAALQALYFGYKAIAFSGDYNGTVNLEKTFENTFTKIIEDDLLSLNYILNVNLPQDKFTELKGMRMTNLHYVETDLKGELTETEFIPNRKVVKGDLPEDSDVFAFKNGYISITKIGLR